MILDYIHKLAGRIRNIEQGKTYSTVSDTEETEEHVLITSWCNLRHHRLGICIVWSLEQSEEDVVDPEIPHVVVSDLVSPQAEHAIEGDEDAEGIGNDEHVLCPDAKVLLDIPEAESREGGASSLRKTEIGDLKEGEGHDIVLDDGDEGSGGVQSVSEKEECDEVDECLGKMTDLTKGQGDLLPTDSGVVTALW